MIDEINQGREPGPRRGNRHGRRALVWVALACVAAAAIIGLRERPVATPTAQTPTTAQSPPAQSDTPLLTLTADRCAGLHDGLLTVGFGVRNTSTAALVVNQLQPSFPLGGLTPDAEALPDRSTCPTAAPSIPVTVQPGHQTVLAFVLTLSPGRATCVAPLPIDVVVSVSRTDGDIAADVNLPAFPDLGGLGLPSDCPTL